MMRAAFRAALTGRQGPVFIAIPDEFMSLKIDASKVPVYPPVQYRMVEMGAEAAESMSRDLDAFVTILTGDSD